MSTFDASKFIVYQEEEEEPEKDTFDASSFIVYEGDEEEEPKNSLDLSDISYGRRAAYGAAQETTIGGNIFRYAKAATTAGFSEKSFGQTLAEIEEERQADIAKMFPKLSTVDESEEDLAILSGRIGVAVADPVTFAIPWYKMSKLATVGAGAVVSLGDTALRDGLVYGEVSPVNLGIAATVGAGSSIVGLGVERGINFFKGRNKVVDALDDVQPTSPQVSNVEINAEDVDKVEQATTAAVDQLGLNSTRLQGKASLLPDYRAAIDKIDDEVAAIQKRIDATTDKEVIKQLENNKRQLGKARRKVEDKLLDDFADSVEGKSDINTKALENILKDERVSQQALRAITTELTKPIIGSIAGASLGMSVTDDADDYSNVYAGALLGLGLGKAWKTISDAKGITELTREKGLMAVRDAGKDYLVSNLKTMFAGGSATRLDAVGGWNKAIGNALFSRIGKSADTVESRTLTSQSEFTGVLSNALGDSAKDDDVLEVVGEYLFGFVDDASLAAGYKGIRGGLTGLTEEQVDEVKRIAPLMRQLQDTVKDRGTRSGIKFEELDFYGMSIRHDYSGSGTPEGKLAHRNILEEAARIQLKNNPDSSIKPAAYANGILETRNTVTGRYNPSQRGASPFTRDADGNVTFRKAADFFENQRTLTDPEAIKYLAENGKLILNSRDVITNYGHSSLKVFEFADTFGPNGEVINLALSRIRDSFKGKTPMKGEDFAGEKYTKSLTDSLEAYFGGYGQAGNAATDNMARVGITLANTSYLTLVSIANLQDAFQPLLKSGFGASLKAMKQKVSGKSFAQLAHFKHDQSYERELETLLRTRSMSNQGSIPVATDALNKLFFTVNGLRAVTKATRNFAYDAGVNRAYELAKKSKLSRVDLNEVEELGLSVDDLKKIAQSEDIYKAFESEQLLLDTAGRKAAERDAIIPNVGNRALFTQTNNLSARTAGQFLSWSYGKASEVNALANKIEDGDLKPVVRFLGVYPLLIGLEEFRQLLTNEDFYYDRPKEDDEDPNLQTDKLIAKVFQRSGQASHPALTITSDFVKYGTSVLGGQPRFEVAESILPAYSFLVEAGRATIKGLAEDIPEGDLQGFIKKGGDVGVIPGLRATSKIVKALTGEDLLEDKPTEEQVNKQDFKKGGEVDVPRAASEPDERVDKMTGMPYDQQAGTAFVDEEDPLRRLGFGVGGEVDPLKRLGFGA